MNYLVGWRHYSGSNTDGYTKLGPELVTNSYICLVGSEHELKSSFCHINRCGPLV